MLTDIPDDFGRGTPPAEARADNTRVWADGAQTMAARHDAGEFVTAWAARYSLPVGRAMDAIAEVHEELEREGHHQSRDAAIRSLDFVKRLFMVMSQFKGSRAMIHDIALFALGQEHLIPGVKRGSETFPIRSQQDLADRWKCKKANIVKNLKWLQTLCGIPERPDQRDPKACQTMRERRKLQLKRKI